MTLPYRAEHLGSFLRPAELLEARAAGLPAERLRVLEDRHVLRVLARQQELGFQVVTDGELRRRNFMSHFVDAVDGFDMGDAVARSWQAAGGSAPVSSVTGIVTAAIRPRQRLTGHEWPFLRQHATGPVKMTLPSATQFPAIAYKRGVTDHVYRTHSDLLWDVVSILRAEVQALAEEGVAYIQIDAPRYSYYMDPKWRGFIRTEMGLDPEAALDEAVRADNACLEGARRPGLTLAIHLCRGNNRSHWYAEGGLESADALARRIDEAARHVPLDRLAISPQCGFASTMEGNLLDEDAQWAKLDLVVRTARRVWG
jgi:5-methyltetrahydropteroyltriglutamate--homocysteine methyltransferase